MQRKSLGHCLLKNRRAVPLSLWFIALGLIPSALTAKAPAADEQLVIKVIDRDTGEPIAARMHLKDARGRSVRISKLPYWKGYFVFDGQVTLKLREGNYTFEMECGPEYLRRSGYFTMKRFGNDVKTVDMKRFANLANEGWWSGDLHIHRPIKDIELLMRANDLHVAPVITWWNKKSLWKNRKLPENLLIKFDTNRFYHLMAGEDERAGGALMFFNLPRPIDLTRASQEYPSPMIFLEAARETKYVHIDIEKPFWWDVPVWLASGKAHSIGLANNHMHRESILDNEAWGKPRDKVLFPKPWGNGRWSQEIYYHILNAGLKIPPSAGSASGVIVNPVGYNRVYVYVGKDFTYEKWWEGLRAGRVVVTNGPLLQPNVEGKMPGHTFSADQGEEIELEVALTLSTQDKIDYLEVIKNGRLVHAVRLDDWAKAGGKLPLLNFKESGWFLVRAVTSNQKTYRFASTGPYYVSIDHKKRISKKSSQFFLDWVRERAAQIKLADPRQQQEVMRFHKMAEEFWQHRVKLANAE